MSSWQLAWRSTRKPYSASQFVDDVFSPLSLAASYPGSMNNSDLLKTKSAFNNQARHKVLYRATEGMKRSKRDKRIDVIRPLNYAIVEPSLKRRGRASPLPVAMLVFI